MPESAGYGQALYHDPFQEEPSHDEDDSAIEEALRNARLNNTLPEGSNSATRAKQANVRDTLGRFASAPKRPTPKADENSKKPAMDVNAFTRMLLTGQGGSSSAGPSVAAQPVNDSASSTDTTSTSQRSIFETASRTVEETPRSSSERERDDEVQSLNREARKPPPPPRPRHGKPVSDAETVAAETNVEVDSGRPSGALQPEAAIHQRPSDEANSTPPINSAEAKSSKKPPPPPIARRKSQKQTTVTRPEITRNNSSGYSLSSENEEPLASPPPTAKMAPPPPPPSRRPNSQYGRRPSTDLPATYEQDEDDSDAVVTERPTSSSKRISQASLGPPPPVPPPRKNKNSGRSSMDSQHRPSMAALGIAGGSARSSSDLGGRPGGDSRNVSGASNAADILADLEALQREVDAARAGAGR